MIPKIIHYCWLSNDNIPKALHKYIDSWKEKLQGYEFMLWDFERFDMNNSLWVKQAIEAKKYAFAADFVRFHAVYNYGGIYLDTDIEVIKPFDDLLNNDIMIGYEDNETKCIESGCFGAEKHSPIIKKCLEYYNGREFIKPNGDYDTLTLPKIMKEVFQKNNIVNISFYPSDYFTAKNFFTGIITVTDNTYCIHNFSGSWMKKPMQFYTKIRNKSIKIFGYKLGKLLVMPILIVAIFITEGFSGIIKKLKDVAQNR